MIAKLSGRALAALALGIAVLMGLGPGAAEGRVASPPTDQPLESRLQDYLGGLNAAYGVVALDLEDGQGLFVNADESFPAASMYKLLVMYRVFQAIEGGDLSPDDVVTIRGSDAVEAYEGDLSVGDSLTVAGALDAMITWSSNSAAYALTRNVGGWGAVASAADELGMGSTYLAGEFLSSPQDMALFFRLLADRSLISPRASDEMIALLLRQTVKDRIPALLPGGVDVAHKTGELPGVRNDGGIVSGPGGRYVLVVMSRSGDPDEQIQAEAEISRMVYGQFGA